MNGTLPLHAGRLARGLLVKHLPLLLGAVALAPYVGLVAGDNRVISGSDYAGMFLPLHEFAYDEVRAGRVPLWLPYITCGAPLHAEQHVNLLYPPGMLFDLLLGPNVGIKANVFCHLLICYVGQFLLARELAISPTASGFAAVAATWGAFPTDQLGAGHVAFVIGYCLIPWFFFLLLRSLRHPAPGTAARMSGLTLLFALGSHPQVFYYALLGGSWWLAGWVLSVRSRKTAWRALVWLLISAAVTIAGATAQWLPALELIRDGSSQSDRGARNHASTYSMDGDDLARVIVPRFTGDARLWIEPFRDRAYEHERGVYLGIIVLPLIVVGLRRAGAAPWQWGAAWLCLAAAEIAMADHSLLWDFFCSIVPGLRWFRCQGRIFSLVAIAAPLVAARGLDALVCQNSTGTRRSVMGLAILSIACAVVLADGTGRWLARAGLNEYLDYAAANLRDEYRNLATVAGVTILVLLACRLVSREFPQLAYLMAFFVLACDLYEYNVRHFQLLAPAAMLPAGLPAEARRCRFAIAPRNLYFSRTSLQYSSSLPVAITARVSAINTFDGAVLPGSVSRLFAGIERAPHPVLALASCEWVYVRDERRWCRLDGALPRLRFVSEACAAICARPITACTAEDLVAVRDALRGEVRLVDEDPCRLDLIVEAPESGILVVADTNYPGWRCAVDGQETTIRAAHGVFRGVRLPPGQHRVEFVYQPRSFQIGLALSAVGLTILVGIVAAAIRGQKRQTI